MLSRKRNGCQTISLSEHLQRRRFSLSPALLGFSVLVAHHQLCRLLETAAGDSPLPTLLATPPVTTQAGVAWLPFWCLLQGAACSELTEGLPLVPGREQARRFPRASRAASSGSLARCPPAVSITFLLLPTQGHWVLSQVLQRWLLKHPRLLSGPEHLARSCQGGGGESALLRLPG